MYFQIKSIILWPNDTSKDFRFLKFEEGKLNVITGASRTGKSAIIPIIDYCLASSKCTIPVGIIRDKCSWFGIHIQTKDNQILLARKTPENGIASDEMYRLSKDDEIKIPALIEANSTCINVKTFLNDLCNIPIFRTDQRSDSNYFNGRPSFRDMISLNFQPQNIVADQNTIFYKTESFQYRERLKKVFPFALGAITAETMAKQFELVEYLRLMNKLEKELQREQAISEGLLANIQTNAALAKEYGLWPNDVDSSPDDAQQIISILRDITKISEPNNDLSEENIIGGTQKLRELRIKEEELSFKLSCLRNRVYEMDRLKESMESHATLSKTKRDRLKLSKWLLTLEENDDNFFLEGQQTESVRSKIRHLSEAYTIFENEAKAIVNIPAAFDREYSANKTDIMNTVFDLNIIKREIQELEVRDQKAKGNKYKRDNIFKFIGSLETSINSYESVEGSSELNEKYKLLQESINSLKDEVDESKIKEIKQSRLTTVATYMSKTLPDLDLEPKYIDAPCRLSINDLGLIITLDDGSECSLSEIGSGSNWVSYHIALTVALQKLFAKHQDASPIVSFIIYDQPSQVYFPQSLARRKEEKEPIEEREQPEVDMGEELFMSESSEYDEDVLAVKKIFSTIASRIIEDQGEWQAIVLDHAPSNVWGDIEGVNLVDTWRDGAKLIPEEWL